MRHRTYNLVNLSTGRMVMQGMLFLYPSIPLATTLWPWLDGRPTDGDPFRVAVNIVTLVTLTWTWNYVKDANRVAADALQRDINTTDWDTPMHVWWGLRFWRWGRARLKPFVLRLS